MEPSASSIREVTFGAKVRGYDPEEVDEFIAAVADSFEALEERYRRAAERATRAEQELASRPAEPVAAPVAEPVSQTTSEISKVWERAVAAAESAITEAKQTAQELMDEAKRIADTQIGDAKSEALRIAEQSQAELRIEIARLEQIRDQLKSDTDRLSGYLEEEREKVRAVLSRALAALDDDESEAAPPPPVVNVQVGEVAKPSVLQEDHETPSMSAETLATALATGASYQQVAAAEATGTAQPATPAWSPTPQAPATPVAPAPAPQSQPQVVQPPVEEQLPEEQPAPVAFVNDEDEAYTAAPSLATNQVPPPQPQFQVQEEEEDQDPFLAELRRAVQDDVPLGPRDEETDEDGSIGNLYAEDEEDGKGGFFRRKK